MNEARTLILDSDSSQEVSAQTRPLEKKKSERTQNTNMRKALAGFYVSQGRTLVDALTLAGYAEWTANVPEQNGLSVERCLAAWEAFSGEATPAIMLGDARKLGRVSMLSADPQKDRNAILRFLDLSERYYGGRDGTGDVGCRLPAGARLSVTFVLMQEAAARGLIRGHSLEAKASIDRGNSSAAECESVSPLESVETVDISPLIGHCYDPLSDPLGEL